MDFIVLLRTEYTIYDAWAIRAHVRLADRILLGGSLDLLSTYRRGAHELRDRFTELRAD